MRIDAVKAEASVDELKAHEPGTILLLLPDNARVAVIVEVDGKEVKRLEGSWAADEPIEAKGGEEGAEFAAGLMVTVKPVRNANPGSLDK